MSNKWLQELFFLPRIPEPEIMGNGEGTEAYSSAVSQAYLDEIDNTFVEHALGLGVQRGLVLDIGTGPGQIPIKLALKNPRFQIIGLDLSETMLEKARENAEFHGVQDRVSFQKGDAKHIAFPGAHFDLVVCNSLLHHASHPLAALNEIARVSKPAGAILLRDLRRPLAVAFAAHVTWFGRHYRGLMKKLYVDSVKAAYTPEELETLLSRSEIRGGQIFRKGLTHIGIERRAV